MSQRNVGSVFGALAALSSASTPSLEKRERKRRYSIHEPAAAIRFITPLAQLRSLVSVADVGLLERLTTQARRVVLLAREEARLLNHNYIGTEHILLGLIREGEGVAAKALESIAISLEAARVQVEGFNGRGTTASGYLPFTPRTKRVFALSEREAQQRGHDYVDTEHILLGLIREGEGVGVQVLVMLGADTSFVRRRVIELLPSYEDANESEGQRRPPDAPVPSEPRWATVAAAAEPLDVVEALDERDRNVLSRTCENLLAQVRHHLHEGTWRVESGCDYGVEEEVQRDLDELVRTIWPLTDRKPDAVLAQIYIGRLSQRLMEVAQRQADADESTKIERLQQTAIAAISDVSGSAADIGKALDAVNTFAFAAAWRDVEKSADVDDGEWKNFVDFAEAHRGETAATLLGWRSLPTHEKASAALGAMTSAGGLGFFAQGVAAWVGVQGAAGAAAGTAGGLVGAVVGAVLGVLAVRFVPSTRSGSSS